MPSSKSSFRHVIRDRKSSPEIIIVSNENTVFLNPKHLAWKITGTTEMTMSITASTGTMENIGFSSGTATVATSDVPIVLNGSDSTSNTYGFSIAEAIVSKIVTTNAVRAFESSLLSNKAASGNMIAQGQSAPCRLAIKIRFVGMVDGADTSVKGNKKARQINGLVNEWYLEDMSENIKSSLDDLRRKGHHIGAWVRYGYMKDPNQKGHIIPDPVAAAVVERIFKMYLEGNSRADIARILNSEQIPPPGLYKIQQGDKYKNAFMAGEWDSCSISRILKEEMYIGNMVQGRQASESYKTKKLRTLPKEDWIRVIGTHEAIISLETWNQTQALLAVGARSFTRSEEIGLFSRKVYCGHCNKLMRTGRSKRKSGTYYNYVICVRRHPEINPCPVHAVSNALMEKTILDQLDILAAKYKDGSLFSEIMDEESTIGIEIKRLKAELAQHKKKLVEYESGLKCLYLDKASGSISNSDYQFLSRELSAGKELAERKVDLCTENYNKILRSQEILREKAGVLESYSRPKELTRSMVETFIDHIVICSSSDGTSKQEIKIYWNF